MGVFQPRFIFADELSQYGLPTTTCGDSGILDLVDTASLMIDEYCGRTDGDGNGSLVYTTYTERILSQSPGRNVMLLPHRPPVGITQSTVNALSGIDAISGNYYYTGCTASINTLADGRLSAIIGASGRYVPGRRDQYPSQNDLSSYLNPLTNATLFGGPPPWTAIDMFNLDYDAQTGEIWFAGGLYLLRYSEVMVEYNSGYDPRNMPKQIKRATAAVVKNLMAKGNGTTGMTRFQSSKIGVSAEFTEDVIDENVQRLLAAFVTVRAT